MSEREPAVGLSFSSRGSLDANLEPEPAWWSEPRSLLEELEPLETKPALDELEIPAVPISAPPTEQWNLESRSPIRRAMAVAAACVPLMLTTQPVFAAPPTQDAAPLPNSENATITTETTPTVVPAPTVVQEPADSHPDAIWSALRDRHVVLTLADGSSFRGTVLSVTDGVLVCARQEDGLMLLINAAQVTAVHVEGLPAAAKPPRPQNGQGLIVMGSIATAIGGALAIATVAVAGSCMSGYYNYICPYYTLPLGVVGAVNLAVGIPLLATGLRKRAAARDAEGPAVSAFVAPGRNGVMGGVGLRF